MRKDLQAMRQAGIKRARFSGVVELYDRRCFVALRDVEGPTGTIEHCWVKPDHWHGPTPQAGGLVEFTAEIRQYWKGSGEEEFGLFDVRVLQ
jgi:hypothetical protein